MPVSFNKFVLEYLRYIYIYIYVCVYVRDLKLSKIIWESELSNNSQTLDYINLLINMAQQS